jgi:hypothetical protein
MANLKQSIDLNDINPLDVVQVAVFSILIISFFLNIYFVMTTIKSINQPLDSAGAVPILNEANVDSAASLIINKTVDFTNKSSNLDSR